MAARLLEHGFELVSGGTDNHLILIDLSNKSLPGKVLAQALDKAGIVTNYNSVPYDTRKPFDPSGIRIGTPAVTTQGMGETEMTQIADWMNEVTNSSEDAGLQKRIAGQVRELCKQFPAPGVTAA